MSLEVRLVGNHTHRPSKYIIYMAIEVHLLLKKAESHDSFSRQLLEGNKKNCSWIFVRRGRIVTKSEISKRLWCLCIGVCIIYIIQLTVHVLIVCLFLFCCISASLTFSFSFRQRSHLLDFCRKVSFNV